MKIKKLILALVIVFLFTIISAEVVYLTTLNKKKLNTSFQNQTTQQSNTLRTPSKDELAKERTLYKLINDIEKGYIHDAILSTYYQGGFIQYEILSSAQNQRYIGGMKISFQVDTKEQDNITTVIIPANVVSPMQVLKSVNGQLVPATIDDIKAGAIIRIQMDQRITETDPVEAITQFTITIN